MADINVVRTLTVAGATALKVVSGSPAHGLQTEDIDVSDLSNAERMEKAPRPQLEETEMNLQTEYDGTLAAVRTSATLTVTVTKANGDALSDAVSGYIKSAIPVGVDVAGERRLLQDIVFVPDGSNTTTTTA